MKFIYCITYPRNDAEALVKNAVRNFIPISFLCLTEVEEISAKKGWTLEGVCGALYAQLQRTTEKQTLNLSLPAVSLVFCHQNCGNSNVMDL